jgi:D-3-phosphoglycerate dehydrogenase
MKLNKYFVIDFDSTFTKVEAFDVLAEISLKDDPDRDKKVEQIKSITNQGMDGSLSFRESLEKRVAILSPNKRHLTDLLLVLKSLYQNPLSAIKSSFKSMPIIFTSSPMDFMRSLILL